MRCASGIPSVNMATPSPSSEDIFDKVPPHRHSSGHIDWNEDDLNKIGTSSIDTTCTIWDIEKECVDTQLIAHDREVYDIAWGGAGVFASVSADGSVRVFDLR